MSETDFAKKPHQFTISNLVNDRISKQADTWGLSRSDALERLVWTGLDGETLNEKHAQQVAEITRRYEDLIVAVRAEGAK